MLKFNSALIRPKLMLNKEQDKLQLSISLKEFSDSLVKKVMYDSKISSKESNITIVLKGKEVHNETN